MSTDAIVALRFVHDHPKFHNIKAHEVEMTKVLMESCRQARKKYFDDQRSRALSAEKLEKEEAKKKVNEEIDSVNTEIRQTISLMENLKKSADEIGFRAEKRTSLGKSFLIYIFTEYVKAWMFLLLVLEKLTCLEIFYCATLLLLGFFIFKTSLF